jgi:hypothetical protein
MSNVNRRILETIEKSDFPPKIKALLKSLLMIELRDLDKIPRYGEDYDRVIKQLLEVTDQQDDD